MNIENILSKNFSSSPSPAMQQNCEQIWKQFANFLFQQPPLVNNNNKPLASVPPPPANSYNPLLQCNMYFPFIPGLPFPSPPSMCHQTTPAIPSSQYSIESILSAPQKLAAQITHPSLFDASLLGLFPSNFDENFQRRQPPPLRAHVTRESSKPLREWMTQHIHDPYPNNQEIQKLADITGFSHKQVRDWFTNNRRRYEQKHSNKPLPWKKRESPKASPMSY